MTLAHDVARTGSDAQANTSSSLPGPEKGQVVTPAQRAAAARIRMVANKKLGRPTARWIKDLAKSA